MQHSAIHDPRASSTPSQRLRDAEHKRRLEKFHAASLNPRTMPPIPNSEMAKAVEILSSLERAPSIVTIQSPPGPVQHRIEEIQIACARHYGVTQADMISARRQKHIVIPRHVAMYLCRELTLKSHPEIARRFGGRDHCVSLYASNKINGLVSSDEKIASDVAAITASLAGAAA